MASKNKKRESRLGQFLLVGYVGLCVVMVVLALVVAFSELSETTTQRQRVPLEAAGTPTISPVVLTLEAQEAAPDNAAP